MILKLSIEDLLLDERAGFFVISEEHGSNPTDKLFDFEMRHVIEVKTGGGWD